MNISQLIASAERELAMRRRVYPRRVANGRMSQRDADHETKCMEEIVELLKSKSQPELFIFNIDQK